MAAQRSVFPLLNSRLPSFSEAHQMEPLGRAAPADRELFTPRLGLGAHGGANGLMPLLPANPCESDQAIRVALGLGERQAEKCAMKRTLSRGFLIVSA